MVFTTPQNSIPGSAVCKFTVSGITDAFMGDFKVQVGHNVPTIASRVIRHFFKKRKMKGGISLRRKIIAFLATSICCVYKEKIVKNDSHSVHTHSEICSIQLGSLTNQFNSKQVIQILQIIVIDYFSTHS